MTPTHARATEIADAFKIDTNYDHERMVLTIYTFPTRCVVSHRATRISTIALHRMYNHRFDKSYAIGHEGWLCVFKDNITFMR